MKRCKVEASVGFFAFLCVFYYFNPAGVFFPFLLAASLHELGHLLAISFLRLEIHSFILTASGAVIETTPLSYRDEIMVSAAGPMVNLILLLMTAKHFPLFALVNLCLFLYNMLPLYPLDGGRAVRAILHLLLGETIARRLEAMLALLCLISIVSGSVYLTCVWHAGLWPILLGGLVLFRVLETILPIHRNFS